MYSIITSATWKSFSFAFIWTVTHRGLGYLLKNTLHGLLTSTTRNYRVITFIWVVTLGLFQTCVQNSKEHNKRPPKKTSILQRHVRLIWSRQDILARLRLLHGETKRAWYVSEAYQNGTIRYLSYPYSAKWARYRSHTRSVTSYRRISGYQLGRYRFWLDISTNLATVRHESTARGLSSRNKGGKFLKKLWCCVGGSITR